MPWKPRPSLPASVVLGVAWWLSTGCALVTTGPTSAPARSPGTSTPARSPGASMPAGVPAPPDGHDAGATGSEYSGADAVWMPDTMDKDKTDAEELVRAKGFTGAIVSTGDTDPKFERDELVCGQSPKFGKFAPGTTVTLKYCNHYKTPASAPILVGLTVEAAKKRALEAGFTGKIEVFEASEFDAGCKAGIVCSIDLERWYLNQEHTLTLYVNRSAP